MLFVTYFFKRNVLLLYVALRIARHVNQGERKTQIWLSPIIIHVFGSAGGSGGIVHLCGAYLASTCDQLKCIYHGNIRFHCVLLWISYPKVLAYDHLVNCVPMCFFPNADCGNNPAGTEGCRYSFLY